MLHGCKAHSQKLEAFWIIRAPIDLQKKTLSFIEEYNYSNKIKT